MVGAKYIRCARQRLQVVLAIAFDGRDTVIGAGGAANEQATTRLAEASSGAERLRRRVVKDGCCF